MKKSIVVLIVTGGHAGGGLGPGVQQCGTLPDDQKDGTQVRPGHRPDQQGPGRSAKRPRKRLPWPGMRPPGPKRKWHWPRKRRHVLRRSWPRLKAAATSWRSTTCGSAGSVPSVQVPETTVPGLGASFEILYMRPSRSNLDYAISDPNSDTNPEGRFEADRAGLQWRISVRLELQRLARAQLFVDSTCMLNTKDSDSAIAPAGGTLVGHP